jgi:hypothetical protein
MKYLISVFGLLFALNSAVYAAGEPVLLDYEYQASRSDPDLRKLKGTISIAHFGDARNNPDAPEIRKPSAAESIPLAEIITEAFVQAFRTSGAEVAAESGRFVIDGQITEVTSTDREGSSEIVIRASISLKDGGRTIWENGLFSRASAATEAEALQLGITKLVQELLVDDYFLMEVI